MDPKDPGGEAQADGSLQPNPSADEFFSKMNRDFRRPKPSEEAVAAALQAIQAMTGDATTGQDNDSMPEPGASGADATKCSKCGGVNSESNRFCGFCGATLDSGSSLKTPGKSDAEQHVHHHHYHHHYFPAHSVVDPAAAGESETPAFSAPPASATSEESAGADLSLRRLVESWARAFNGRHAEELCALYSNVALLVRSGAPLVRGRVSIKQVLQLELEGGLGDVQLDCTEIGIIGELACVAGASRMLAPVAPANRRERTGKFLMLVRQEGADWKILADVWCLDAVPAVASAQKPRK